MPMLLDYLPMNSSMLPLILWFAEVLAEPPASEGGMIVTLYGPV